MEIQYPHFYDVASATDEQSLTKGYNESGFYFFTDETETAVIGPFHSFENAEASRVEYRTKGKVTPVDTDGSST